MESSRTRGPWEVTGVFLPTRYGNWPRSSFRSTTSENLTLDYVLDAKSVQSLFPLLKPYPHGVSRGLVLIEVSEVEAVVASLVDEDLVGVLAGVQVEAGYLAAASRNLDDYTGERRGRWRCLLPASGDNESDQ